MRRALILCALIAAGESIFFLPFVLARVFRPTLLDVFGITNLELGLVFAVYGIVAMPAYFLGGPLADRFRPRKLIAVALLATAAGGVIMMTIPGPATLKILYGYWGVTTIALFWAALIRATREWGSEYFQGAAFGLLDGGRGLMAAATGTVMVAVYAALLPEDVASASMEQRSAAFSRVIEFTMLFVCATAVFAWIVLPDDAERESGERRAFGVRRVLYVLRIPSVWYQALIILCAYVGFKSADDFSLYASEILNYNEVEAARAGTVSLWMRPIAAIGAGFLADRFGTVRMTLLSFGLLFAGSVLLASGAIDSQVAWLFFVSIVCSSLGIFALRGLYFAIMQEGRVPLALTGSAVGFVSFIGFTPDVFMGPLMGYLLDQSPGAPGHQHVFWVVAGFAIAGFAASLGFRSARGTPP